jgi:hypothetical protein
VAAAVLPVAAVEAVLKAAAATSTNSLHVVDEKLGQLEASV